MKIVLSILLLVISVYYIFTQITLAEIVNSLSNVNFFWIIISLIPIFLSHWIRAYRWKMFLKPQNVDIPTSKLFSAVMIGYFFNAFTMRFGEIIRPMIISNKEKISLTATTATIFLERIIDLIFLFLLFLFTIYVNKNLLEKALTEIDTSQIIIFTSFLIVFMVIILNFKRISIFIKTNNPLKTKTSRLYKISSWFNNKLLSFSEGFNSIKSPKIYFELILISFLIWLIYVIPNYLIILGMGFDVKYNLNFIDAICILVFSGLAITFSPTPGAIGLYHAFVAKILMMLYGIERSDAFAFAVITHFINYISQVAIGGYYFMVDKDSIDLNSIKNFIRKSKQAA